jgi:hypothetical protein
VSPSSLLLAVPRSALLPCEGGGSLDVLLHLVRHVGVVGERGWSGRLTDAEAVGRHLCGAMLAPQRRDDLVTDPCVIIIPRPAASPVGYPWAHPRACSRHQHAR